MPTIRIMWILSGLMALASPVRLIGQDWPTFAHDAWRSAATSATVSLPLGRSWEYEAAHPPRPAWPPPAKHDYWHDKMNLSPRVTYDHAFQVAAVGDRVYFGTSGDDRIVCLDGRTGECCWSFYTEGPVRLAPTVVDGRVFAGSDDGMVYCLAADGGELIWKQRVGPADSRCIGNGRMISRWPVRSGVLVQDGIAYGAGGLFPMSEGVYLAGFAAKTGEEKWRRKIDQSVQGYMALTDQQLVLPSGRTSPSVYARQDGQLLGEIASGGGAFALVADDLLAAGPGDSNDGTMSLAEPRTREPLISLSGLHLIASGRHLFVHTRTELAALDRDRFLPLARERAAIQKEIAALEKLKDPTSKARSAELARARAAVDVRMKACWLWRTPCLQHESLILAGDKLFAGGDERVAAFDANQGNEIWSAPVRGRACGLACAQGRLLVSTDLGSICCFEPEAVLAAR
ncbi:MAG: hypothetical protein FJ276_06450, partial [Planctomycetes bacterium]|nr:hypothetical protein [Planctomycetota bacterium]